MSPFVSRVLIAAVGAPVVIGVLYLGGWSLFALTTVAALIGLHELYWMTRTLRPVVLAGYLGALAALLGATLSGPAWVLGGFLSTFALAFVFKGVAGTRHSMTISVGLTLLGAGWIGLGLAHAVLLREIPAHGRLAAITVVLAVWAADAAAYLVGYLVGRHKLAPSISPGKTWEGFVAGAAAAVGVCFIALYKAGFLTIPESLALGAVIAVAAPLGDLFESAVKRDMGVKDASRLLAAHGGMLDRLDAILFSTIASYYFIVAVGHV
jgi:phosphatidate cytidylyltransferase